VVRKLREWDENMAFKCAGEPYPSARSSGKPFETNLKPTYYALRPGLSVCAAAGGMFDCDGNRRAFAKKQYELALWKLSDQEKVRCCIGTVHCGRGWV